MDSNINRRFSKGMIMKWFSKVSLFAMIFAATNAFAQEPAANAAPVSAPAPTEAQATETSAPALSSADSAAIADSLAAAAQFNDFMNSTLDDSESSSSTASSSTEATADTTSSSSGDGGLVLYDGGNSDKPQRRVYSSDAPIYRFEASVGLQSPSRGLFSLEYVIAQEILNAGLHFTDYNDEVFQLGASVIYYPMETRYFYTFLSNDWISGKYDRERSVGKGKYEEYTERLNVWRVSLGIGCEALFMMHFGAYVEVGFEFFAAKGGYYLHMNKKYGSLDNDDFKLPYGIGVLFPF